MRNAAIIASLALVSLATAADGAKKEQPVWTVSRTSDPITGTSSCVVSSIEHAGSTSYTRTGSLYPIVEMSSTHGLLVGVSSGGRMRVPTGDILWRVDDKPFRTIRAADNPPGIGAPMMGQDNPAMKTLMEQQVRAIMAATATSTLASGKLARDMLDEMVQGRGLLFRAAAAAQDYGLSNGAESAVGQVSSEGQRPYPLDDSFRFSLAVCGITLPQAPG